MTTVLYACTIPAFHTDTPHWHHWLENAEAIAAASASEGVHVEWYAVLQYDGRGRDRFFQIEQRLEALRDAGLHVRPARYFSLDPPGDGWTTETRLQAICTARNLMIDEALRAGHDWIYFADSDMSAPDDVLLRLLEVKWPVVGANCGTYCLDGPVWQPRRGIDLRLHFNTAGSLLVRRDVFRRVPWRYDPDDGLTDDPATQREMERYGHPTVVRHDVSVVHNPAVIMPLEHRGLDLAAHA